MPLKAAISHYPNLETERLFLRPVSLADLEDMYAYASDEETVGWTFPVNQTLDDTRQGIERVYLADPVGKYALVHKASGRMIGTLDCYGFSGQEVSIGLILNKGYWRQGLATEALTALLSLLRDLGCQKVHAGHAQENVASQALLTKVGFQLLKTVEADQSIKGQQVTSLFYELKLT